MRETLGILLGAEYDVESSGVDAFLEDGRQRPAPHLLIAAAEVARRSPATGGAVLWIADERGGVHPHPHLTPGFSAFELRRQVRTALQAPAAPSASTGGSRLAPPFVPAAVAATLAEAAQSRLPLHLAGEPGVGKRALARALHRAGGSGRLVWVDASEPEAAWVGLAADVRTVCIDRVETLAPAAQQHLLAALDPIGQLRGRDGGRARLLSAAAGDLAAAVDAGRFDPALYYQLTVLHAVLPPLRERPQDIAALAQALATDLAAALERRPVRLSARALQRLTHYLWFGNLAELEAVLARSLALLPGDVLEAEDLLFDGARPRAGAAVTAATPGGESPAALAAERLDLIINELAHEFKNPLVTLKTFAHHLRGAGRDGDEAQVARLTGEAVEQIDRTLENLLEFTRLESPAAQALPLAALLAPVLEDCRYALGPRGIEITAAALPSVAVEGDPQQLAYALGNLLRALTRDLPAGAALHLGFAAPAAITLHVPGTADPLGNHLATLLDRGAESAPAPPLGVAIAHAVLARNGAELAVAADTPSTVVIRFRRADADPTRSLAHGTTARPDR